MHYLLIIILSLWLLGCNPIAGGRCSDLRKINSIGELLLQIFRGCTRLADMLPSKYEDNTLQIKEKSTERTAPFFLIEFTARSAADLLGIHPNSAVLFYRKIRMVISHYLALAADEVFEGSVELDESYFGGRRKGRRGRGAAGKVVVFGILKRNGWVYTVVVDNAKSDTLMPVIKQKIMPDSIVYTDNLSSYDKLDVSGFIHYRFEPCGIGVEFRTNLR